MIDGALINEHTNDIGDWCPWSGRAVSISEEEVEDGSFSCPAMCADSGVEE